MPLVTYSALRIGLLAACFALGYWAGLRTWLLLGVAVLAAWALSYVLLAGPRDAAASYLATRSQRRRERHGDGSQVREPVDDDETHEDALVDRALADADAAAAGAGAGATTVERMDVRDADAGDGPEDPQRGADAVGRPYPGETASPRPNSAP